MYTIIHELSIYMYCCVLLYILGIYICVVYALRERMCVYVYIYVLYIYIVVA